MNSYCRTCGFSGIAVSNGDNQICIECGDTENLILFEEDYWCLRCNKGISEDEVVYNSKTNYEIHKKCGGKCV